MNKTKEILCSKYFVSALLVLVFNDLVLKSLIPCWITGKLSDFAGLFIFPLFFLAFLPKFKNIIFAVTGFLFMSWKSPFSESFIIFWNSLPLFNISRVADYSDLLALLVLPAGYYFISKQQSPLKRTSGSSRLKPAEEVCVHLHHTPTLKCGVSLIIPQNVTHSNQYLIAFVSLFAFCATSYTKEIDYKWKS